MHKPIHLALMLGIMLILLIVIVVLGTFVAIPDIVGFLFRNPTDLLPLLGQIVELLLNFFPVFGFMIDRLNHTLHLFEHGQLQHQIIFLFLTLLHQPIYFVVVKNIKQLLEPLVESFAFVRRQRSGTVPLPLHLTHAPGGRPGFIGDNALKFFQQLLLGLQVLRLLLIKLFVMLLLTLLELLNRIIKLLIQFCHLIGVGIRPVRPFVAQIIELHRNVGPVGLFGQLLSFFYNILVVSDSIALGIGFIFF